MNRNDLMDALSGLDPKYIEEAAFELNGGSGLSEEILEPKDGKSLKEGGRKSPSKKIFYIALPSIAAALLILVIAYPIMMRVSKSESSSAGVSYEAESYAEAYDSEAEAVSEAPSEDVGSGSYATDIMPEASEEADRNEIYADSEATAEEAAEDIDSGSYAADTAPEEAEARNYAKAQASSEAASEAIAEEASEAAEEAYATEAMSESAYEDTDNASYAAAEAAPEMAAEEAYEAASAEAGQGSSKTAGNRLYPKRASYNKGILTIEVNETLPDDFIDSAYTITGADSANSERVYGKGTLKDILSDKDPLTLDISDLRLAKGRYLLKIEEDAIEFMVNAK